MQKYDDAPSQDTTIEGEV